MPIAAILRDLQIDLPACPDTLVKLSVLMADDEAGMGELSALIAADMAMASAVVRTLNSALFGLVRRVDTVHEACQYLGMAQVASLTYEISLRSAFPPTPAMQALWNRARIRGQLMGRLAQAVGASPWKAHTAGLFMEAGRAVLMVRDPTLYADPRVADEAWLNHEEQARFGVHPSALGAALCRTWRLSSDVADAVRAAARPHPPWPHERDDVTALLVIHAAVGLAQTARSPDGTGTQNAPPALTGPEVETGVETGVETEVWAALQALARDTLPSPERLGQCLTDQFWTAST